MAADSADLRPGRGGGEEARGARAPDIPAKISREVGAARAVWAGQRAGLPVLPPAGALRRALWLERGALAASLDGPRGREVMRPRRVVGGEVSHHGGGER